MADPITLAAVGSMAGSAAGGVVGAFGAKQGGEAKAGMYQYQSGISRMQASFNRQNADETLRMGTVEGIQLGMKQRQQLGQIIAAKGASGLDVNSGTNAKVIESQQDVNKMDQDLLRHASTRKSYAYRVAARGEEAQAELYDMAARNSIKEGKIESIKSLIGGATSVSSKWMQGRQMGAF